METILLIALAVHWIAASLLVYRVALLRGRNPAAWAWGAALVLTPLLALIALAAMPVVAVKEEGPTVSALAP